jgi:hypothetical protein
MIKFNKKEVTVFLKTFRQFIYFVLMFSFIFFIHFIADKYKNKTFDEHSIIENMQLIFLITSGCLFCAEAIFHKKYRPILFLLSSLTFLASCRELDMFFDKNIPVIGWEIGFLFPVCAIIYAYKNKRTLRNTLIDFSASSTFSMMCCAMIIIFPIAQCIGHGPFVRDVIGDYRVGDIKEFFEESCETMGYFLIVLSSIEFYLALLKPKK